MAYLQAVWKILNARQRRASLVLLVLIVVSGLLETLGVGLVIPVLVLVTQSELAVRYPALVPWLNRLGNPSQEQLVVASMLLLVSVYVVKGLFLAYLGWRQACYVYGLQADFQDRLLTGYLRQPYTFHLQRNSSRLLANVNYVSSVTQAVGQTLSLIAETFALLGIAVVLVLVQPLGALLVVSILGLAGWCFNQLTRRQILRWGEAARLHEALRLQHLHQGLGAAKDIKLLGREDEFLAQYRQHNLGSTQAYRNQAALGPLPRLWLELLAVAGLAGLVVIMINQNTELAALVPTLGLFAVAAFRLMPSVTRVIGVMQTVRFAFPLIETVCSELCLVGETKAPVFAQLFPFQRTLSLDQISFRYPAAEPLVLNELSLVIPRGASVGFVGGSGAGKSTLVDIILGLLTPTAGVVRVDDSDVQTNLRGWQNQIGYVPQSIFLTDDTIRRNVAFGLAEGEIDDSAVGRALRAAQLDEFVADLPQGLETKVGERGVRLSGGQRQRIGIARALYHDPAVLVLDEATSALDVDTERGVMEAVRTLQGDKTILIVAHRLSTIQYCQKRYRLNHGRIAADGGSDGSNQEELVDYSS